MSLPFQYLDESSFRNLQTPLPVPQARVYNSAAIATVTTVAKILTFDSERFDSGDLHSTSANTSRLTAPITGLYLIGAAIEWAANAAGYRQVGLILNGATFVSVDLANAVATAGLPTRQTTETIYQLAAGDYVEVTTLQNSGGNLNVNASANYSPEFWMVRLGGYVNQGV